MPTIVDALLVTLGLDSREFKAGAAETRRDMDETKEKSKETAEELKKQGEEGAQFFDKLKDHALEFFGVIGSGWALLSMADGIIKSRTEMFHLKEQTGMATEEISKWQSAVKIAGGSAEEFNASLKGLGGNLVAIEKGLPRAKRALVAFQAAGIQGLGKGMHVETTDVLDQIHEKFSNGKLSLQEAMTLGSKMGIQGEAMIRILHKQGAEYEELMAKSKALGVVREEDAAAAEKAEESMNTMKIAVSKLFGAFASMLIPVMGWAADKMTSLAMTMNAHKPLILGILSAIALAFIPIGVHAAVAAALTVAGWVASGAASLLAGAQFIYAGAMSVSASISAAGGLVPLITGWISTGIAAAWAWVMATGGLILLIPLIALLIGGIVKLYNKFEGFRNVVGSVFNWIKNYVVTVFLAIWDVIKDVFAAASDAVNIFVGIFTWNGDKIKESWHSLWEHCKAALHMAWMIILFIILSQVTLIIGLFGKLLTAGKAMWSGLKEAAMEPLRWIEEKISKIVGMVTKVASIFGKAIVTAAVAVSGGAGAPASASTPSIHTVLAQQGQAQQAAISRNTTNQSNRETHIGQITVQTQATDAQGIAKDIGGAVKSNSLVDHADRGMV
jgi:MFS family permease